MFREIETSLQQVLLEYNVRVVLFTNPYKWHPRTVVGQTSLWLQVLNGDVCPTASYRLKEKLRDENGFWLFM